MLFITGVIVFLIGLSWGGTTYPWKSAAVLCSIIGGALTLVVFGLYEAYVFKGQALMPPRLFKKIEYVAIIMVATIAAMVYCEFSLPSLLPHYPPHMYHFFSYSV